MYGSATCLWDISTLSGLPGAIFIHLPSGMIQWLTPTPMISGVSLGLKNVPFQKMPRLYWFDDGITDFFPDDVNKSQCFHVGQWSISWVLAIWWGRWNHSPETVTSDDIPHSFLLFTSHVRNKPKLGILRWFILKDRINTYKHICGPLALKFSPVPIFIPEIL